MSHFWFLVSLVQNLLQKLATSVLKSEEELRRICCSTNARWRCWVSFSSLRFILADACLWCCISGPMNKLHWRKEDLWKAKMIAGIHQKKQDWSLCYYQGTSPIKHWLDLCWTPMPRWRFTSASLCSRFLTLTKKTRCSKPECGKNMWVHRKCVSKWTSLPSTSISFVHNFTESLVCWPPVVERWGAGLAARRLWRCWPGSSPSIQDMETRHRSPQQVSMHDTSHCQPFKPLSHAVPTLLRCERESTQDAVTWSEPQLLCNIPQWHTNLFFSSSWNLNYMKSQKTLTLIWWLLDLLLGKQNCKISSQQRDSENWDKPTHYALQQFFSLQVKC